MSQVAEIVWSGRGPLTEWPERDWLVLLNPDRGFMPVWDQWPMTSSSLWAKWMTGRDGRAGIEHPELARDDGISRTTSVPPLVSLDIYARVRQELARRTREAGERRLSTPTPPLPEPERAPEVVAMREVAHVKAHHTVDEPIVLCSKTNKVRHHSKLWALHHRNQLASLPDERFPERLEAYKCKSCGDWHVGHRV